MDSDLHDSEQTDQIPIDFSKDSAEESEDPTEEEDSDIDEEKRQQILKSVHSFELDNTEKKVAWVLNKYPKARDSDSELIMRYWQKFELDGSKKLSDLERLHDLTKPTTIVRARRTIQYNLDLFNASAEVQKFRGKLSDEEAEKASSRKNVENSIDIHADESGKNAGFIIVGSVWVLERESFEINNTIAEWKEENNFDQEIHFKSISRTNVEHYHQFIEHLFGFSESFLSFKGICLSTEGISDEQKALGLMFYHLLRKGIRHEAIETERAPLPREIRFYKDEEYEGTDTILLEDIRERLEQVNDTQFDGQLRLGPFRPIESKFSMPMQLADLFTSSLNRVINQTAADKNYKDEFAEKFLELAGMPNGPQFKHQVEGDRTVLLSWE
ncbi:DUF3800 domain-containing protein [Salinibacter ruber]|uniref:DUF3800 domain-containing protein n=1 Tax=Salinibacter ruber TaxID=146919 RepID=UPI0021690F27|nr:DUF3800 domain-containing protein [Salinibacter ruber]MCS3698249.1 hypothetical protein [Salinibacter ruber]